MNELDPKLPPPDPPQAGRGGGLGWGAEDADEDEHHVVHPHLSSPLQGEGPPPRTSAAGRTAVLVELPKPNPGAPEAHERVGPKAPSPATRLRRVGGSGLEVTGLRRRGIADRRAGDLPSFPFFGHFVSPDTHAAGVLAVAAGEGGEVAEPPLERETGAGE